MKNPLDSLWGTVITGTLRIDCVVPTSDATWGGVKSIYR